MMRDHEPNLYRAFRALRREDERQAPPFQLQAPAIPALGHDWARRARRARPAFALALLLLAAVGLQLRTRPPAPPPAPIGVAGWRAPTDVLLRNPAAELWNSTPRFGNNTWNLKRDIP